MALTINTNIKNDADGYLIDAKNVKGTYVVVEEYSDLANLPEACLVEGTLAYVQSDTNYDLNSSLYRYKGNSDWEKVNFGSKVITKSLGLINPDEPVTFTVTSEELPYSFLALDAPECFLIGLAFGNINNMFRIYFTNYAININRYGVPSAIQYTTLFYYNDTQYLVVLTIDTTTPLQTNNATLSFQELQAGSGGGSGSQEITIEQNIRVISLNSLYPAPVTVLITQDNLDAFFAAMSSVAGTTINEDNFATIWASLNTTARSQALGVLLTMYKHSVDYDGQPVLKFDSNDLSLYVAEVGSAVSGATPNEYELNCIKVDTGGLTDATVTIAPLQTITITGGGSGGTGSSRTLYHIEVADSNNHKATIPIYKEAFDKYLVEMNQVGAQAAQGTGITWTTLNNIDDLKTLFDTQKSTQYSFGCDLAMNLLVRYAYESGENPTIIVGAGFYTINSMAQYDLANNFLGAIISLSYDSDIASETIQVDYDNGNPVNANSEETTGSIGINRQMGGTNEIWFKSTPLNTGYVNINSNATFTYTAEEIAGGGSSGEGIPTYRLYFKQFANVTLNRGDENDEDFTLDVNNVVGFEFQSKNIVSRFNDYIGLVNARYSTSFSTISSENEIVSSIKTIISTLLTASMTTETIYQGICLLICILSLKENVTTQQFASSTEYTSFDNNYPIHILGTTEGYFDTNTIYEWENYYDGVLTIYGSLVAMSLYANSSFYRDPFTNISNQNRVITGESVKLSLVDNYDLVFETIETAGGSSSDSVSGGSGKLYEYSFNMVRYDINGNVVGDDTSNSPITRYFKLFIYESNFERFKTQASQAGITLNTPQDLVTLINNTNENIAHIYSGEAGNLEFFLLMLQQSDFCFLDTSYNNQTSSFRWNYAHKILYISGNRTITTDKPNIYGSYYYLDEVDGTTYVYGLNTNNSCTLTEYGTSGSGSGDSEPTIPERFSIAQNLVVNMNGEQYKPNQANWSGSNSDNIRQFKVGSSVAPLTDIQALLSHLTGNPTYDVYNATKPTPCFVFCTESNICWKLQYDGETNGLRAYKVVNFPFVIKENRYEWEIRTYNGDGNSMKFYISESAMQDLITQINQIMPTVNPSWVDITNYNGIISLFDTLKQNASDTTTFGLILALLGCGGYVFVDHNAYSQKTPIYFIKLGSNSAEVDEVKGIILTIQNGAATMLYKDPNGVLTNGLITNDSSQASDGVYIDSDATLTITKIIN